MAQHIKDMDVFDRLLAIVNDEEGMCALLSRPQQDLLSHFTAQQTARWTRLAQHFSTSPTGPQSDDETEEPRGTPARASSKRKREKATGEPAARSQKRTCGKRDDNDPWYRFTKLESLEIPALYEAHLQKHGSDAAAFLNDQRELTRLGPEARSDEGDAFLSRLQYTLHLQGRMAKDRIRWCFSMLLYFDLAQLENPGGSGRVGGAMQKRIRDLVKDRVPADRVQDLHLDSLTVWSTCGKKLDIICKEFGEGSLFFLDGLLSEYFLKRFTASGDYFDNAFANLRSLDLREKAEVSGANELARNVRAYMVAPLRKASLRRLFHQSKSS